MKDKENNGITRAPLAYENPAFINGPDARVLRILAEYLEPLSRFRREQIQDTVVFFGSARFTSRSAAQNALELLEKPGSRQAASPQWQQQFKRAHSDLQMARYYEDARRLAFLLTEWSLTIPSRRRRFVLTTGGGPGIMEAANEGAAEAGGKTIGLNINLPYEQMPNRWITPELNFEFHYFFMRKLWFAYLAKALVVFPGGFGTFDELFEILTLAQTDKLAKRILVVVYGSEYWKRVINFDAMVDTGVISPGDLDLFKMVDTPEEGFEYLKENLIKYHLYPPPPGKLARAPEIAKTRP
ncbi:MAG: TIGR00730 family Rossman fold protein [Terriglobales bacterium]